MLFYNSTNHLAPPSIPKQKISPRQTNEEWEELIRRLLSRKEEILYKDLQVLCSNMKFGKKQPPTKKLKRQKQSGEYGKVLKRDKL